MLVKNLILSKIRSFEIESAILRHLSIIHINQIVSQVVFTCRGNDLCEYMVTFHPYHVDDKHYQWVHVTCLHS